ncbi:MAG: DUF4058 family protein [Chloroflexaceae bacterium]|nr:DUF4058 family protein [Chloroflexaceae bacterium]
MPSPFPGMDPYLELSSIWPDVHSSLIVAMRNQLQVQLVPRYIAQITPYIALEQIEITPLRQRAMVPDVGVYEHDAAALPQPSALIDAPPLTGTATLEVATRYSRIEIRAIGDETLVTAIELLSPANKRPGADGADAYEKKRQELFHSMVHLLEIDLLRGGRRPQLAQPATLPAVPYFLLLSRSTRWPQIDIWPCRLQERLPTVPVPLRSPDPDVALNLTAVMQQVYDAARYDLWIDYTADPPPPVLSAEDGNWLAQQLRAAGLR